MVHGFLSSRAQWQDNLIALRAVCSPVVIELYGHGRSPAPDDSEFYYPDNYVEQFEKIRRSLGCEKWSLCGYSLGAGLTIRYALNFPDKVLCHVFTNSTSGFASDEIRQEMKARETQLLEQYKRDGMAAVNAIAVHPRNAKAIPKKVRDALLADCERLDPMAVARTIIYTNGKASVRREVGGNIVPALLVCGKKEKRFHPFREYLAANMTGLEIVDLEAGHAVNAEVAQAFNQVVTEFLSKHTL